MASGDDEDVESPVYRLEPWIELSTSAPRDLTRLEFAAVMPPRGPTGAPQNRLRGLRARLLKKLGFTVEGKTIT